MNITPMELHSDVFRFDTVREEDWGGGGQTIAFTGQNCGLSALTNMEQAGQTHGDEILKVSALVFCAPAHALRAWADVRWTLVHGSKRPFTGIPLGFVPRGSLSDVKHFTDRMDFSEVDSPAGVRLLTYKLFTPLEVLRRQTFLIQFELPIAAPPPPYSMRVGLIGQLFKEVL